jgi:hypothetical protein
VRKLVLKTDGKIGLTQNIWINTTYAHKPNLPKAFEWHLQRFLLRYWSFILMSLHLNPMSCPMRLWGFASNLEQMDSYPPHTPLSPGFSFLIWKMRGRINFPSELCQLNLYFLHLNFHLWGLL